MDQQYGYGFKNSIKLTTYLGDRGPEITYFLGGNQTSKSMVI